MPGPLLGVIVGTPFAFTFALPITLVELPANLTAALNVPTGPLARRTRTRPKSRC
ncbi:MAG: hypothetical protein ACK4RT_09290 [Erythrobacter sp.]